MQKLQVTEKSAPAPTPAPLARDNSFSKFNNMPIRVAEPAKFYWFDPQHAHFQLQAEVEARIVETAQFECQFLALRLPYSMLNGFQIGLWDMKAVKA